MSDYRRKGKEALIAMLNGWLTDGTEAEQTAAFEQLKSDLNESRRRSGARLLFSDNEPRPPRTDTERLDAMDADGNIIVGRATDGSWSVRTLRMERTGFQYRPTLRAAIDAYLDAEQQSEQGK